MTGFVTQIWRHPIKAHGREELRQITLEAGKTMPWDRAWAVARVGADVDGSEWVSCGHFSRAATSPNLQAITAKYNQATGELTLSHPDQPSISFHPDGNSDHFLDWTNRLMPAERPSSAKLVRAQQQGMTDTRYPSISILNSASNADVSKKAGRQIALTRWRGNIVLDGLRPWEEFDWIGKRLRIGTVTFQIKERIERCQAPSVDPETGSRDIDMLNVLKDAWGHTDFGVFGVVETAGKFAQADMIEVLS